MGSIIFGNNRLSTDRLNENVSRAATGFSELGIGRNGGVGVMMRNEPVFVEATLAAGIAGAYSVPINWHAVAADVNYILEDSGASALVVHADLLPAIRGGIPPRVKILVAEPPEDMLTAYGITPQSWELPPGAVLWPVWRDSFEPRMEAPATPKETIFYTSGTTGRPKGVRRPEMTLEQMQTFGIMLGRTFGLTGEHGRGDEVTTVVTGPMYHGLPNGLAMTSIRAGANIVIMPRFDPEALLQIVERHQVTHLNMVPIMFNRLLRLPRPVRERYDLSSLRFVMHGAAPVAPGIKRDMIAWWGNIINELYGSAETGNVAFCTSDEWLAHPGTVGKAPPGTEIRIVDKDGRSVPAGEVGEIVCRIHGAGEMTYINNETARSEIERTPGLLTAGDVGYLDEDGFLFVCDRNKDMVISGGVNIYPAQIEGALHKMPGIEDCAVFGIPDEEYGESIHAVIEPAAGAMLDAGQITAYLRQHIPGYMIPRSVSFANGLPREDSGKLFKRKLREPFWANLGRAI